jgi:hypothetical protein
MVIQSAEATDILRKRLGAWSTIDQSAQMPFLGSAHSRLELLGIVDAMSSHALHADEALNPRMAAVIAAAP